VMLVEGVHHGSGSDPVFYPSEVIMQSAADWNRMPVPVYHPTNQDGDHVLCNDNPKIANEWSVGWIENARFLNGKLHAEVWINIEDANQRHPGLIDLLDAGEQMDVSTGLLALSDETPGTWNDESYAATITQIIPDHLALLPGTQGACSWDDGCGIRVNKTSQTNKPIVEGGSMKIHVQISKNQTVSISKEKMKHYLASAVLLNELSHNEIANQIYTHVDSMDVMKPNNEGYAVMNLLQAIYDNYFVYSVRDNDGRKLYKQNYSVDADNKLVLGDAIVEVREDTNFIPVSNTQNEQSGGTDMKTGTDAKCCPKKVQALIANGTSAYTADDQEFLENLTESQLDKIVNSIDTAAEEATAVALLTNKQNNDDKVDPTPVKPDTMEGWLATVPGGVRNVVNAAMRGFDIKRTSLMNTIKEHPKNAFDDDQLKAMDMVQLENVAALVQTEVAPVNSNYYGVTPGEPVVNQGEEVEVYVPQTIFMKKD